MDFNKIKLVKFNCLQNYWCFEVLIDEQTLCFYISPKKNVNIYGVCICGKSLEGKRAGTKTCSPACRKQLSLKNKVISSPQEHP